MKLYELRVEKVCDAWGKREKYKTIGFYANENKAIEAAKAFTAKNEINQWWMSYGRNIEGHINIEIIDRGEIIE